MKKHKIFGTASIVALACGVGILTPKMVWAESSADTINKRITDGETQIVLDDDITGGVVIPAGKEVTLQLNNHKITGASGSTITNEGTLTIAGEGEVISTSAYAVDNHGTLTIDGGSYSTTVEVDYNKSKAGALVGSAPSLVRNGWDGPTTDALATLTINGGNFTGGLNNVKNDEHGVLTITGGNFTNEDGQNLILNGGKSLTITGGTYSTVDSSYYFGVQNQRMGADTEKTVDISGVTLPSFGFTKDEDSNNPSIYAVNISNSTINKFWTTMPMTTRCTEMNLDNVTSNGGISIATACTTSIKNSAFNGGGVTLNKLTGVAEQPKVTVENVHMTGGLTANGPIVEAKNTVANGYGNLGSKSTLTLSGGSYKKPGSNLFKVANGSTLIVKDDAELEGNILISNAIGGTLSFLNGTLTGDININNKVGGNVDISGGQLNGQIIVASAAATAGTDKISLTGGEYSVLPDTKYVAEGYDVYDTSPEGPYFVEPATEVNMPDQIFLAPGEKCAIDLSEVAEKYGTLGSESDAITINGNEITAVKPGSALVNFNLHNYVDPYEANINVVVYSVTPASDDETESAEDANAVASRAEGQIMDLLARGENSNGILDLDGFDDTLSLGGIELLKTKLVDGQTLTAKVEGGLVDPEEWEYAEAYDRIVGLLREDEQIAAIYDKYINLYSEDGTYLGFMYSMGSPITMNFEIPAEYLDAPDGYNREFSIIRGHLDSDDAESAERLDVVKNGNTLTAGNDKFSSFAVTYADVAEGEGGGAADDSNTSSDSGATTQSSDTSSPETGVVTKESGSAIVASIITAVAVGLITSIVSLAVLIRRK